MAISISSDRRMYVEDEDLPSKARSAGLCEELGQVCILRNLSMGDSEEGLLFSL